MVELSRWADLALRRQSDGDFEAAASAYRREPDPVARLGETVMSGGPGLDFLIIGAPRSATSWLKSALRGHADITMAAGEPQYFAYRLEQEPRSYLAELGASRRGVRPALVGDKSPASLAMEDDRIELCAALFPRLKLILLVRDPAARAWSHLKRLLGESAFRADFDRPVAAKALIAAIEPGWYRAHLRRWGAHFASDQILIVDFHRIALEPQAVCNEVLAFLGLPRKALPAAAAPTASGAPPEALRRLLEAEHLGEPCRAEALRPILLRANQVGLASRRLAMAADRPPAAAEIEAWRAELAADGRDLDGRERLAELLVERAPAQAVQLLAAVPEDRPGQRWRALLMTRALERRPDTDAWFDGLVRLKDLQSLDAHRSGQLARLLSERGRHAEAADHARATAEAEPRTVAKWKRLADILYKGGDLRGERQVLQTLLDLEPGDLKTRARLATLLDLLGRRDEAAAHRNLLGPARSSR